MNFAVDPFTPLTGALVEAKLFLGLGARVASRDRLAVVGRGNYGVCYVVFLLFALLCVERTDDARVG